MFYVYILFSEKLNRYYIGTTDNYHRRLDEHNHSKYPNAFTKKGIPWKMFQIIECQSSDQAYKIEKHIKSMRSTTYIKNLNLFPEIIEKLKSRY